MKQREAERANVEGAEYSPRERLAGAFIIGAILLLIGAIAFSSQVTFLLSDTFTLHAEIDTAEDVSTDARVNFLGIEIGRVTDVRLTPDQRVMLTLKIREKYHDLVREDSIAELNRLALLGDVSIDITHGDPGKPPIADGASILVRETPPPDALLSRLAPVVDDIAATTDRVHAIVAAVDPAEVNRIVADARLAVGDMRDLADRINTGEGTVGRLLNDEKLAADVAAGAGELVDTLKLAEARLKDLQPVIDNTAARTREMEALIAEGTALVDSMGELVDSIGAEQGRAISGVLLETRSALDEAEKTLRAIRNTWPFSSNAPETDPPQPVPPQPPAD